jgi:hypothetical protein
VCLGDKVIVSERVGLKRSEAIRTSMFNIAHNLGSLISGKLVLAPVSRHRYATGSKQEDWVEELSLDRLPVLKSEPLCGAGDTVTPKSVERFPDYEPNPRQLWVEQLNPQKRAIYEGVRAQDIAKDAGKIRSILHELPDFAVVADEAIDYVALRFGQVPRDCYEEGIQVGLYDERQRAEVELTEYRSGEIARLGGYG